MPLLHVVILALVQGITEFLPISSSGHLILAWTLFDAGGWDLPEETAGQRLILDVAVHVGTLFAVMIYFRRDLAAIALGLAKSLVGRGRRGGGRGGGLGGDPGARLALHILVATLPLVLAGYLLKDYVTTYLRDEAVIAWATLGFGLLLYAGDRFSLTLRRIEQMTWGGALLVGLAQVLALVPGTSRSGITITAARFLGFERAEAARFSMLLAIPAILGAGTLAGLDLYAMGDARLGLDAVFAAGLAFLAALAAIALMMAWLRRASFTPFVVYRVILGAALLWFIY